MNRRPTALIAEDEEPQRDALRRRLAALWPELELVAEARNGIDALALVGEHEPEIVFLDIRMPGLSGVEVAQRIAGRCHLVFVTAYDEYAVQAFETEAVDYLLKPVSDERLTQTVARLKTRLRASAGPDPVAELLRRLALQVGMGAAAPLRWLRAARGEEVQLLPVEEVRCLVAADKYTSAFTANGELLLRKPIKELEAELDPTQFCRIHRNAIVNLSFVDHCRRDESGRQWLRVRGMDRELSVSRPYGHLFKPM